MNTTMRLLASASVLAVATFAASPAMAAGTASGTTITNNVSVDFQVGGVGQTQVTASDSFTVDRKVNLTVAEVGSTTTSVSPGQTAAVTAFTVTNVSNATLDLALAATQLSGGTAAHGGTDNFDVTGVGVSSIRTPTAVTTPAPIWRSPISTRSSPTPAARCSSSPTFRSAARPTTSPAFA